MKKAGVSEEQIEVEFEDDFDDDLDFDDLDDMDDFDFDDLWNKSESEILLQ